MQKQYGVVDWVEIAETVSRVIELRTGLKTTIAVKAVRTAVDAETSMFQVDFTISNKLGLHSLGLAIEKPLPEIFPPETEVKKEPEAQKEPFPPFSPP